MTPPVTAWLREQSRPVRRLLNAGIAAGAAQAVLICLGAWLVAHVLAEAIFAGRRLADLWPAIAALPLLAATRFALVLWQRRATFEAGARVGTSVRLSLEERMRLLGPRWAARQSSGDIVTRFVDGVETLIPYYAGYLPQVAFAALVPAVILLAVLSADPWSALVLLVTAPLIPLFMVLVGRAAEQASQRRWSRLRRMGARFMDALSGLTTLRLCRATEREQALLAATGEAYRQETMAVLRIAFLSALVLEFFATISIAVLAVLIGFRLMWGTLAFEPGLFVLLLAPELFLPLRALGTQRHRRLEAAAAAEDLIALLATPVEAAAATIAAAGSPPPPFAATQIGIAFEQIGFGYTPDRVVLHDLDLGLDAGTELTLVGASGSGKSTLFNLLMGFAVPQRGRILVNGEDLTALDIASWRRHIAWLSQRAHVFHGTLRENLLIAAPGADDARLERAVQAAALVPVIARLPRGLDTPLGEHGQGLSGGERQRLALARAWLRDAPLLLLDEPTQHLDGATAAVIDTALAKLVAGRTVIRIAHRLDSIAAEARVAVMSEGRIVEVGRAGELRATHGAFARLLAADRAA
ncbi:MAG: thiol reductant ABC exporter subunit CydD [Xanthomonadaceae bacterium]|nr:thiol reductant ABC exporter subunit CydD [Xanthomonadaceae bacterium]